MPANGIWDLIRCLKGERREIVALSIATVVLKMEAKSSSEISVTA